MEKERIEQVFNNFYYDDFSNTNVKNAMLSSIETDMLNDFMLMMHIVQTLIKHNKRDIHKYRVLDAGCGNGRILRKLNDLGFEQNNLYGIDVSEKVIDYAKHNSPHHINFSVGDIAELPFDGYFDIICCFGVLIHVLDDEYIRKIAFEFKRVLVDGGLIFLVFTDSASWSEFMQKITRNIQCETIQSLFSEFKLKDKRSMYNDFYGEHVKIAELMDLIMSNRVDTHHKFMVFQK